MTGPARDRRQAAAEMTRREVRGTTATSFDLFGTLVDVETPANPAEAVAAELEINGVTVPPSWEDAYSRPHGEVPPGEERPLPAHVRSALEESGVSVPPPEDGVIRGAVRAAFEPRVRTRAGAEVAVCAAAERGPVGVLSNCSVPGLVERTISLSTIDSGHFDAIVSSVDCGWRKPDPRAFKTIAGRLGVPVANLRHVGDDPRTDGGATAADARAILLDDVALADLPSFIRDGAGNSG